MRQVGSAVFRQVYDAMSVGIMVVDQNDTIIHWNKWLAVRSNLAAEQVLHLSFSEVFPELVGKRVHAAIRNAVESGFPSILSHSLNRHPFNLHAPDTGTEERERIDQSIVVQPLLDEAGQRYALVEVSDVTAQVKREALLRQQVKVEQAAFENIATILNALDGLVYVSDMETYEMIFVNSYAQRAFGEIGGRRCYEYLQAGQEQPCAFCTNHKLVDANGEPTGVLVWEFQNTLTKRWYQCRDQAIRWYDGRLVRMEVAIDINEIKENERRLEEARKLAEDLALRDSLTRALNRRAFFEQANAAFQFLQRNPDVTLSFAMMDIDHFKKINDTYGHAVGDEALIQVAATIQGRKREMDGFYRIGGEEFVLMLIECAEEPALALSEELRQAVSRIELQAGGVSVPLSCSIGVAQHRHGASVDEILAEADVALYHAKKHGRNCTVLHSTVAQLQSNCPK